MIRRFRALLPLLLACILLQLPAASAGDLELKLRSQVPRDESGVNFTTVYKDVTWNPEETAIVVCDMWDHHYCPTAEARVGEMAPRMNEVLHAARKQGVLIIHSPSGTLDKYVDHPARKRAQAAPAVEPVVPLKRWCYLDEALEGTLPINDQQGGCDAEVVPPAVRKYTKQHDAIDILAEDAITDSEEAYYLIRQRGIKNVIIMGVHTNMCVLGRPFGIRQLSYQGLNVALMRDMTDTMYDPRKEPYVSHFTGTDYVVSHIERNWAPTLTSVAFLGGQPFRFTDDNRPRLLILIGESEYDTEKSLPVFAAKHLGKDFSVDYAVASKEDKNRFEGLEAIDHADALLISVRRRTPPTEQLDKIKAFVASGKPVIGIRTASHAFDIHGKKPPKGHATWSELDAKIWGGSYHGHYPNKLETKVYVPEKQQQNTLVSGLFEGGVKLPSWLYMTAPVSENATVVLMGQVQDKTPEPVAWTHHSPAGGRVFYTSLGHVDDFANEDFQQMLTRAIYWAADVKVPKN